MNARILRALAIALAFSQSSIARAQDPAGMLRMRGEAPASKPPTQRPSPGPVLMPAPADVAPVVEAPVVEPAPVVEAPVEPAPVVEPTPIEPLPTEPPAPIAATNAYDDPAIERAHTTRDLGASLLVGGGVLTVSGVVLILAGFGATGAAIRNSDCADSSTCGEDRRVKTAARVTLAGLGFATLGAGVLIGGMITYGVGQNRLRRASMPTIGFTPGPRGATLGMSGRF